MEELLVLVVLLSVSMASACKCDIKSHVESLQRSDITLLVRGLGVEEIPDDSEDSLFEIVESFKRNLLADQVIEVDTLKNPSCEGPTGTMKIHYLFLLRSPQELPV